MRKSTGRDFKFIVQRVLILIGLLIVCLPLAFIVTLLLLPLWSWIEATTHIESAGHSGPSDWCFFLVYGVLVLAMLAAVAIARR